MVGLQYENPEIQEPDCVIHEGHTAAFRFSRRSTYGLKNAVNFSRFVIGVYLFATLTYNT